MKNGRQLTLAALAGGMLAVSPCLAEQIESLVEESLIEDLATGSPGEDKAQAPEAAPAAAQSGDLAADADKLMELEAKLAEMEAEKARLEQELREVERRAAELKAREAREPVAGTGGVRPGSDLFTEIERENARLKERFGALEAEKGRLEKARADLAATSEEAEAKLSELEKQQAAMERLVSDVPDMQKEIAALRADLESKSAALREREKALQAMAVELQTRERRLIKAERMRAAIEEARSDVKEISEREKRDMHYNMAAVYAREGRYAQAESEYLRALRIDPSDADAHFNLAVLYEERMDQPRRAVMHYRRYLMLRPHAADADTVKAWLLDLETAVRE